MGFPSIDALQRTLADQVFDYATDRKKAAGRALGTLVEIITFYTLQTWGLSSHIYIERRVPEFANPDIVHNVEFSLHCLNSRHDLHISPLQLPLTTAKLKKYLPLLDEYDCKTNTVLTRDLLKRNCAVLAESETDIVIANIESLDETNCYITVCTLELHPFAIFECKRVGVEEGMKKGPQTIEKAKQGAYVARTVSSLQKIRLRNGELQGIIEKSDGELETGPYGDMLDEAINSASPNDYQGFILTVGIVSNHGNWFTSDNPNKEMSVLAQSYDWLLFLTDEGLSMFINNVILNPSPKLKAISDAFHSSYSEKRGTNRFTKVRMDAEADQALQGYFSDEAENIELWFNIITPQNATISTLRDDLRILADKRASA